MSRHPLVLLPGLACTEVLWRHQVDGLADVAEVTVADLTRDDSVEAMAERILDQAPARFALAGLSMGGYVAQAVIRIAPERVSHLALIDTSARADDAAQRRRRKALLAQVRRNPPDAFRGVTRRLLPLLIHPDRLDDEAFTGTIKAMAKSVGRDAYIRQQTAILGRPDGVADLARIDCPSLIICGDMDALTPPDHSEEIAQGIANARLVVIEDCGHLAAIERPETVNAEMRTWLDG